MKRSSVTVAATRTGRGWVLAISGDLDLTTAEALAPAVAQVIGAVDGQPAPVLLDLAGLAFLDVAGARALVAAVQALPVGHPVTVGSISPPASRLLVLLGWELERLPDARLVPAAQTATGRADSPDSTLIARQNQAAGQRASITPTPSAGPQTARLAAAGPGLTVGRRGPDVSR